MEQNAMRNTRALDIPAPARHRGLRTIERVGTVAIPAAVLVWGMRRRSGPGVWLAAAAVPLVYRGMTSYRDRARGNGHPPAGVAVAEPARAPERDGVEVHESVRLERPVAELYRFWRALTNLPTFMTNLESVTDLGGGRSHWVAKGPAGRAVTWEAEIVQDRENEVIAWRSLAGGDISTSGRVSFAPARAGRGTQLSVELRYAPPAGRLGAMVSRLFGREPSQTIREDLRRLKQILEAGETPTNGASGGPR
jgi:uncharacterized membrane protein